MTSNRRHLNTSSGAYPASPVLEKEMLASLHLYSLLDAVVDSSTSNQEVCGLASRELELHRMLSLQSRIPTTSSEAQHHAAQSQSEIPFRKIGAGACGAIFAQDGKSIVMKLAKTDDELSLWNDYRRHTRIANQFRKWGFTEVRVPECYYFVPKDDPRYFGQRPQLVEAAKEVCNLPTSALVTERIWPLPKDIRTLLIDKYCAPRIKEAAFSDAANKDCLVRVYLGSLQGKSGGLFFSLRNFKMHLNQMVDLQLDVKAMAGRMGIAMAIIHWAAGTDGRDVEFVLGSSRTTNLWLLDFNQVQSITMDEAGVAKAIEAVRINDPYLPRPRGTSRIEKQAWNAFAVNYISAADAILGEGNDQQLLALPRMFIRGLIELQERKKGE